MPFKGILFKNNYRLVISHFKGHIDNISCLKGPLKGINVFYDVNKGWLGFFKGWCGYAVARLLVSSFVMALFPIIFVYFKTRVGLSIPLD